MVEAVRVRDSRLRLWLGQIDAVAIGRTCDVRHSYVVRFRQPLCRHLPHSVSEGSMRKVDKNTAATPVVLKSDPPVQHVHQAEWPAAIIAFGLGLTVAWVCLLGYGLVVLIDFVV